MIMKKILLFVFMAAIISSGCRKIEIDGDDSTSGGGGQEENLVLSGKINADRTLKAGNTYKLRGIVYLVDGATLTIDAGTRIEGEKSYPWCINSYTRNTNHCKWDKRKTYSIYIRCFNAIVGRLGWHCFIGTRQNKQLFQWHGWCR